ncbi:hypothetical protein BKF00_04485 [Salmonella enterica]|nr:hypothetical protein [Salmonella enterica]
MMGISLKKIEISLWRYNLPFLVANSADKETPHDYYSVFLRDAENERYIFQAVRDDEAIGEEKLVLSALLKGESVEKKIDTLPELESEIVHYKKNHFLKYQNIFIFTLDRYLKIITLKNALARMKGKLVSSLKSDRETITSDRFNLLQLLVANDIHQRPSRVASGFSQDEVITLLYGTLWYKHLYNESFRRKIRLLLESLVLTGDLTETQGRYYVQGQAITTLVEHQKEEKRVTQQQKMHRNIVRFMLVITVSTILIILVLLAMAGIIDLHAVWQKILEIKPVRFLLKFI